MTSRHSDAHFTDVLQRSLPRQALENPPTAPRPRAPTRMPRSLLLSVAEEVLAANKATTKDAW